MISLLENQTINGSSIVTKLDTDKSTRDDISAQRVIVGAGSFAGATITITVSGNGVDFAPLASNTFTTPTVKGENLPSELFIKAEVTGATGTTDVSLHVA